MNDVVRTDESTKQVHMTCVEDATEYEDKQCLQRDVTEVDVSLRGAGRTSPRGATSMQQWDRKRMFVGKKLVVTRFELLWPSLARKCCSNQVSSGVACHAARENETSNELVLLWVGNGAHCVSQDVRGHTHLTRWHFISRQPSASYGEKTVCASSM